MHIAGPGHGAPAMLANCYLEGYYSEIYLDMSRDEVGLLKFFQQFSFPGGIGSHCTPETEHPHGLSDRDFDSLFTTDKPVIFNFHSSASLIHKLSYRRKNHDNMHVRGYKEKGSINTPLELADPQSDRPLQFVN